jgi:DDE domain
MHAVIRGLPLGYRHVEELMQERGVSGDHSTVNRWVLKHAPQLEEAYHYHKRPVWISGRMDEMYIKIKGQWRYLSRAVDKTGQTAATLVDVSGLVISFTVAGSMAWTQATIQERWQYDATQHRSLRRTTAGSHPAADASAGR